jgi:hypothetical protein
MNEALNHNACALLVRQSIPFLPKEDDVACWLWTNAKGTGAPDMGLWEIIVRRAPLAQEIAA